jgi:hypothetical protein
MIRSTSKIDGGSRRLVSGWMTPNMPAIPFVRVPAHLPVYIQRACSTSAPMA